MNLTEEQLNEADKFLKEFRQFCTGGHQIPADELTPRAFFLLFIAPSLLIEVREHRLKSGQSKGEERNG